MSKIKIAFLQHGLNYGGAGISLYLLQKSLDKNIFEKYLFFTPLTYIDSQELKNIFLQENKGVHPVNLGQIHNHQCGKTSLFKFYLYKSLPCESLITNLIKYDIDILHVNSTVFPHVLGKVKNKMSLKIVTHVRELIHKNNNNILKNYMVKQIYQYSDAIVAISENEAQPFLGHPNLHILPNPFHFAKIEEIKSSFREDHNIEEECTIIGMVGQLTKFKGHMLFLQAAKKIIDRKAAEYPFLFVILGAELPKSPLWKKVAKKILRRENYIDTIQNYIQVNNISRYIKLLPYTLNVFDVLKAMDIVVRPSLSADPWGRDVIEAMALGKPTVATGTSEFYIENGVTGYLVPPQPQLLAEKILELITDPDKRKLFGQKGYSKVREMCDLERYGQEMTRIYQSLMDTTP